jgi:hypothetical protein
LQCVKIPGRDSVEFAAWFIVRVGGIFAVGIVVGIGTTPDLDKYGIDVVREDFIYDLVAPGFRIHAENCGIHCSEFRRIVGNCSKIHGDNNKK